MTYQIDTFHSHPDLATVQHHVYKIQNRSDSRQHHCPDAGTLHAKQPRLIMCPVHPERCSDIADRTIKHVSKRKYHKQIRKNNPWKIETPCAVIIGGETVVKVIGNGLGGRNQEIALQTAAGIQGMDKTVLFSLASDGTDGPTDAAGGIVNGETCGKLKRNGISVDEVLQNNDSYAALSAVGGLA